MKSVNEFEKVAMNVSTVSIVGNVLLSAFKLLAGVLASSGAMVSDAIHSASDVISTVVVIIGIRLSGKASDKEHPYGHERMECVAAILLATILAFTGLGIGYTAIAKILSGNYGDLTVPGVLALVAALVSIVVKEGMYWYTRSHAKKNQFKCTDGRCMASPLGRALVGGRAGRYCGGKAWLSGLRRSCQPVYLLFYREGGV